MGERGLKQEKYPTYSFTLDHKTHGLREWLEGHKARKQLPAVVRMGLILVRLVEAQGCPVGEDDPERLLLFLDMLRRSPGAPAAPQTSQPLKLNVGEVKRKDEPEANLDAFLDSL